MTIQLFWIVFSLSFLTALTGALVPGPLLTYTIMKSVEQKKHGFLTGLWVITGHAILESAILIALLSGFSYILGNAVIRFIVSLAGCLFLIYCGVSIIINLIKGKIPTDFTENTDVLQQNNSEKKPALLKNPIIGGVVISMSNPYWWMWWASIGSAFLIKYNISLENWQSILAFFAGHEAGDLACYVPVSMLAFLGGRYINKKVYYGILGCCALFLVGFGVYLGITSIFQISLQPL
ncbi:MAG: LysE family transporter [Spirochaetales bacterium]|nr:LysE family transporter [Spirochaetales bacterium]